MWIHWAKKIMKFTKNGRRICLQGLQQDLSKCQALSSADLKGLLRRQSITHCIQFKWLSEVAVDYGQLPALCSILVPNLAQPSEGLQKLLDSYANIFQSPGTLPPPRPFDHHIQLILGAQPVNVRPYRYSPAQKDEIERQVAEMLQNGIIKASSSPYASPVLLVRKKDAIVGGSV